MSKFRRRILLRLERKLEERKINEKFLRSKRLECGRVKKKKHKMFIETSWLRKYDAIKICVRKRVIEQVQTENLVERRLVKKKKKWRISERLRARAMEGICRGRSKGSDDREIVFLKNDERGNRKRISYKWFISII